MGKILSVITKPVREFNLESRAHKVISKDKPISAPKYKTDELTYERLLKEQPEIIQKVSQKNEKLDDNLKNVYLKSYDPLIKGESRCAPNPDRPLPAVRIFQDSGEYGFHEPTKIPYGRVTLRKAVEFITQHHTNRTIYTVEKIANEHLLPEEVVTNILSYFHLFEIYVPQQRNLKATFAGPAISRTQILSKKPKMLPIYKKKPKDIFDN